MLNDKQIEEIKADVNYSVSQLIDYINVLQQENSYLKGQNEILKNRIKGGTEDASK